MGVQARHEATDCRTSVTDWTDLGARLLQAADMAAAVHLAEQADMNCEQAEAGAVDFRVLREVLNQTETPNRGMR
jgi:hypothetical protein